MAATSQQTERRKQVDEDVGKERSIFVLPFFVLNQRTHGERHKIKLMSTSEWHTEQNRQARESMQAKGKGASMHPFKRAIIS